MGVFLLTGFSSTYLESPVNQSLVEELFKHPPDALHEPGIHCLVVITKVDPPTQTPNDLLKTSANRIYLFCVNLEHKLCFLELSDQYWINCQEEIEAKLKSLLDRRSPARRPNLPQFVNSPKYRWFIFTLTMEKHDHDKNH